MVFTTTFLVGLYFLGTLDDDALARFQSRFHDERLLVLRAERDRAKRRDVLRVDDVDGVDALRFHDRGLRNQHGVRPSFDDDAHARETAGAQESVGVWEARFDGDRSPFRVDGRTDRVDAPGIRIGRIVGEHDLQVLIAQRCAAWILSVTR